MDDGPEGRAGRASAVILLGEGQEEEELLAFHLRCVLAVAWRGLLRQSGSHSCGRDVSPSIWVTTER